MKGYGCVGQGFCGGSLTTVLAERGVPVYTFDKSGKQATGSSFPNGTSPAKSVKEMVESCNERGKSFSNAYFVCVPTPMFEDGECDVSIVHSVLQELADAPKGIGERIAIVKSTVAPGSTETWNREFGSRLRVVFSPEFLRELTALEDMRHQSRIIVGGPKGSVKKVSNFFADVFPDVPLIETSSTNAEMVKYFTNIHLAARVILSCEFWQLCERLATDGFDVDYNKIVEYAKYDARLGGSHMRVPGHDGIMSARGSCFPKDLGAISYLVGKLGISPSLMGWIQEKNLSLVPPEHRDWEKMPGRAVSKKAS